MMIKKEVLISLLFLTGYMLVGSGCMNSPKSLDYDRTLRNRAIAYWRLNKAGEFRRSYALLCDGTKKWMPYETFVALLSRNTYRNIKLSKIEKSQTGDSAIVVFTFDVSWMGNELKGMQMRAKWLLENGEWKLMLPRNNNPFS